MRNAILRHLISSLLVFILSLSCVMSAAAAAAGSLRGHVVAPDGGVVVGAKVKLTNPITGRAQEATTDDQGNFIIYNIPHNPYNLAVEAPGFETFTQSLDIHSDSTIDLGELKLNVAGGSETVNVSAGNQEALLETDQAASHTDIDKSLINRFPAVTSSRGTEQILLSTPGFIADENGRAHFRGSHGQMGYVVDGQPIYDQLHITFSNNLDPRTFSSVEVTTGGVSAEYGSRAAFVNVTTKSGLEMSRLFSGNLTYGVSSFNTNETGIQFAGSTANKKFGYFVNVAGSVSDRFLDPINFENLHNSGNSERYFSRFDYHPSTNDSLSIDLWAGRTDHEVPNLLSQQLAGQDQSVLIRDGSINLSWQHIFNPHAVLELHPYFRSSQQQLLPSPNDTPLQSSYDRRLTNYGINSNFSYEVGNHRLKTGIQTFAFPLRESLNFVITDPRFNAPFLTAAGEPDPNDLPANAGNPNPDFNPTLRPFDQTRINPASGSPGVPFSTGGNKTGTEFVYYIQDTWKLRALTINAGLRFNHYSFFVKDDAVQPRVALAYFISKTGTVLRASYDRLFIPPENEGLLIANSAAAAALTIGGIDVGIQPERQNSFEIGFQQKVGSWVRLDGAYYRKYVRNAQDNDQFLNTGVLFPISFAKAHLKGFDLRADIPDHHGFTGYLSFGTNSSIFFPPFSGGLITGDVPTEPFRIDHDQKIETQWEGRYYEKKRGWWMALDGRYDSGLVTDFGDPLAIAANPDIAFGLPFVRATDDPLAPFRIRPRAIYNYSAGVDLFRDSRYQVNLQFNLLNLTDKQGLYNFLSPFGGTHVIPPRTYTLRTTFNF
jgi:Carboxypeptidase regulatory-like domain/TonB-dependent Receptor Plug Domain